MARILCEQEYFTCDGQRAVHQAQVDKRVLGRVSRQKQRYRHRVPSVVRWPVQLPFFSPPKRVQAPSCSCPDLCKEPPVRLITKKIVSESVSTIPFSFECEPAIPVEKPGEPVADDVKRFIRSEGRRWYRKLRVPHARHEHNRLYKFVRNIKFGLAPVVEDDYVVVCHKKLSAAFTKLSVSI